MKDCIIQDSWQESESDNRLVEVIRLELFGYFPFTTQSYNINTTSMSWSKPPDVSHIYSLKTNTHTHTHTLCAPTERNPQPKDTARREQASLEHLNEDLRLCDLPRTRLWSLSPPQAPGDPSHCKSAREPCIELHFMSERFYESINRETMRKQMRSGNFRE